MSFQLWRDEQMSEAFGLGQNEQPFHTIHFHQKSDFFDFVAYFGSPDTDLTLQTKEQGGIANITLTAQNVLPRWEANKTHEKGAIVGENGFLWRATAAGVSGKYRPDWGEAKDARTLDGGVIWQCVGAAHSPNAVKLALSAAGLSSASNSIALGTQLRGGAAVAIHVRVLSQVKDVYGLPDLGQVGLILNDCEAVSES